MNTKELDTLVWNTIVSCMSKYYAVRVDDSTLDVLSPVRLKPYMTDTQLRFFTELHSEMMKTYPVVIADTKDKILVKRESAKRAVEARAAYFAEKKRNTESVIKLA